MKITVYGAAREVTGSCTLIETDRSRVLVDCGMHQGHSVAYQQNVSPFPFDPRSLDAVILTHAHIDHIGRFPKLVKDGFRGRCFVTPPTRLLTKLMWRDAAHVMKDDARTHKRSPAYRPADVEPAFELLHGIDYGTKVKVNEDFRFSFREAGHIFGSAFVEADIEGKRVVFSGDLGNRNVPILRELQPMNKTADLVLCESTYGDRLHVSKEKRTELLKKELLAVIERKGVLMIPAFSLERTQEILYELNQLVEGNQVPTVPIYLDSPLAIRVLPVYEQFPEYYDRAASELSEHDDFFQFPGLHITRKADESQAIDRVKPPKVIIAGSGMMHGGRIMRHLVQYLDDPNNTVLVVGFQAAGTLGRNIKDGATRVHIDHEDVDVKAQVHLISAYSAHADQEHILEWLKGGPADPKMVVLNHGELGAMEVLAGHIRGKMDSEVVIPSPGETIEL